MNEIIKGKRLDFTVADVNQVYEGPAGTLWEMLMGEEIHVGGEKETDILSEKAGIAPNSNVLDICSALGGPARHLALKYGCRVTGLDATPKMVEEAMIRTMEKGLQHLITFKLGNALDMPFKAGTFDIAWGQDAWCYITDKDRLIRETYRVLHKDGVICFTDWVQTGDMTDKEWEDLNSFMAFPYMETMDGYGQLLVDAGFTIDEKTDLSEDFAHYCRIYQDRLRHELKDVIFDLYGAEMYQMADDGLALWVRAASEGKVGRCRLIAKKN